MSKEASKEEERSLIGQFLKPNADCVFCARSDLAFAVNRDWLSGQNYKEMVRIHQDEYKLASVGHDLTPTTLAIHFTKHMDSRGAAINKWARARVPDKPVSENLPIVHEKKLYDLQNQTHLNKFSAADSAVREMISNLDDYLEELFLSR